MAAQGSLSQGHDSTELLGVEAIMASLKSAMDDFRAAEAASKYTLSTPELTAVAAYNKDYVRMTQAANAHAAVTTAMMASRGRPKNDDELLREPLLSPMVSEDAAASTSSGDSESNISGVLKSLNKSQVTALRSELIASLRGFDFKNFHRFKDEIKAVLSSPSLRGSPSSRGSMLSPSLAAGGDAVGLVIMDSSRDGESSFGSGSRLVVPMGAPTTPMPGGLVRRSAGVNLVDQVNDMLKGTLEILEAFDKVFGEQEFTKSIRTLIQLLLNPDSAPEDSAPKSMGERFAAVAWPITLLSLSGFFAVQFSFMSFGTASAIPWIGPVLAGALFAPASGISNCAQIYVSLESAKKQIWDKTRDLIMYMFAGIDKIPHCVGAEDNKRACVSLSSFLTACSAAQIAEHARTGTVAAGKCLAATAVVGTLVGLAAAGAVSTGATDIKAFAELAFRGAIPNASILYLIRSVLVARGIANLPGKCHTRLKGMAALCGVAGQEYDCKRGTAATCGMAAGGIGGFFYTDGQRVNIPEYFAIFIHGLFGVDIDPAGQFAQVVAWSAFGALLPLNFMFMGDGVEELVSYFLKNEHGRGLALAALVVASFTGFPGVASVDTKDASEAVQIGIRANAFIAAAASNYASLLALGPCRDVRERQKLADEIDQLSNFVSALTKYFEHVARSSSESMANAQKIIPLLQAMQCFIVGVKVELEKRNLVGASTISRALDKCALPWCGSASVTVTPPQPTGAPK